MGSSHIIKAKWSDSLSPLSTLFHFSCYPPGAGVIPFLPFSRGFPPRAWQYANFPQPPPSPCVPPPHSWLLYSFLFCSLCSILHIAFCIYIERVLAGCPAPVMCDICAPMAYNNVKLAPFILAKGSIVDVLYFTHLYPVILTQCQLHYVTFWTVCKISGILYPVLYPVP
jgi:hypothetical protein